MHLVLVFIRLKWLSSLTFSFLVKREAWEEAALWSHPSCSPFLPAAGSVCLEQVGHLESKQTLLCSWSQEPIRSWKEDGLFYSLIWFLINKREKQIFKWLIKLKTDNLLPYLWVKQIKTGELCPDVNICVQGQSYFFFWEKKYTSLLPQCCNILSCPLHMSQGPAQQQFCPAMAHVLGSLQKLPGPQRLNLSGRPRTHPVPWWIFPCLPGASWLSMSPFLYTSRTVSAQEARVEHASNAFGRWACTRWPEQLLAEVSQSGKQ